MSGKAKLWTGVLVLVVVILVPGAMLLRSWMNSDSTGTVSVGRPKGGNDTSQAQPISIDNNWFAATLPAGFSIKSQGVDSHNAGELYSVDATAGGGSQIELAVSYDPLPPGGLQDDSGYHLRTTQTNNYAPYTVPGAPAGAVAFRDLNNPYSSAAYVVYWPHGGNYTTVAFTGGMGATYDQLNTAFAQLLSSWKWK